ncbi:Protein LEAD-SENSITIVE 1 [Linum grandiflorum]
MGVFSNKFPREDLKAGDHIYSWRHGYLYSHHGIYVGNGNVIHFTPGSGQETGSGEYMFSSCPAPPAKCPDCADQSTHPGVITSCLDCFLAGGELYRFEYGVSAAFFLAKLRGGTCTRAPSDPPEDVLHRASVLLETNGYGSYILSTNNCEDFAVYCKTGLRITGSRSGQAESFFAAASSVSYLAPTLPFLNANLGIKAAVGFGTYCYNRYSADIGVRSDVVKVPVETLVFECRSSNELDAHE